MTDPSKGSLVRRYLTFATGLVECLCFAGVLFGWASLVFVLKEDNYFSSLCFNVTSTNGTVELGQFSPAHQTWHQKYMALVFHKRCFLLCVSLQIAVYRMNSSPLFSPSLPLWTISCPCPSVSSLTFVELQWLVSLECESFTHLQSVMSKCGSLCLGLCVFLDVCEVAVLCWFVIMKYTHLRNVKDTLSLWGQTV